MSLASLLFAVPLASPLFIGLHLLQYLGLARANFDPSQSSMEDEKDEFYVVRKGDIVGVYRSLTDCQSLLCRPDVDVFKGYRLSKIAEQFLASHELSSAIYSAGVSNVQVMLENIYLACSPEENQYA